MIVELELENIGPYTDAVQMDFRVNKRDKTNLESVYTLPDGEVVTKVVGIIAGNAYGKTTILDSLNAIGSFIDNPIMKQKMNSFAEKIDEEEIKKVLLDYGKLKLIPINKNSNAIGKISVDMYIETIEEFSGYYRYTIKYDNNYIDNGLIEEKLEFRKKYNSKKIKEIFNVSCNTESEIGYKLAYRNNIIHELDLKSRKNFETKMRYYEIFYNKYLKESSTLDAENYIFDEEYILYKMDSDYRLMKEFINLVDNGIVDIDIDDSDVNNKKLYFVYDGYKLRYNSISSATKKICGVALNLYKACKNNGIFLIDELDNSLNKNIAKFILDLYRNNIAKKTSQIIFTTNSPDMVENFRRDQIFIIEKDEGTNNIIKYLNFVDKGKNKKCRKDWSFTKNYNDNIIKNYPTNEKISKVNEYLDKVI